MFIMRHPFYFHIRCLLLLTNIPLCLFILDRVNPAITGGSEITPTNNPVLATPSTTSLTEPTNLTNPQYQQNGVIFNSTLRKELIEAISTRNIPSAILIAKQLAPKLSYTDHWQLLAELGLNRSTIDRLLQSSIERSPVPTVAIDRSINY
jgi:hypothetical protein